MLSTWRELSAIAFRPQEKGHGLRRKSVLLWTDSFCTEQILYKGSSKPHLQWLALGIYRGPSDKRSIRRFVADEAEGILIVPFWRSHKDWAFVANDGVHVNNGIASVQIFNPRYQKEAFVKSPVFDGFPRFSSLVLSFKGKKAGDPFKSRISRSHCLYKGCYKCWRN